MRVAALGFLLAGCGPVLLGEEAPRGAGAKAIDGAGVTAAAAAVADAGRVLAADAGAAVAVSVSVKPVDCGKCFELQALGLGGQPPYAFEWDDGTSLAARRVCVDAGDSTFTVIARDAGGGRSSRQSIRLEGLADAACGESMPPTASEPPALLCLENTSFEGTPTVNLGESDMFDAVPWSTCVSASMSAAANTPEIANESLVDGAAAAPRPTDGTTYLALGEGEQVSQAFCRAIDAHTSLNFALDLARVDLTQGLGPASEQVFLEVWGGVSADCSQRELLWASPALPAVWTRYCVSLHPQSFMDQITLRRELGHDAADAGVLGRRQPEARGELPVISLVE